MAEVSESYKVLFFICFICFQTGSLHPVQNLPQGDSSASFVFGYFWMEKIYSLLFVRLKVQPDAIICQKKGEGISYFNDA